MLSLQRRAGNRAVAGLVAQRCGGMTPEECGCDGKAADKGHDVQRLSSDEKAEGLTSEKYRGEPRLEAAFDNSPPLGIGESGEGVRLVQEGLVAENHPMPKSTKPDGTLDGHFGSETLDAVRDFQTDKELPGGPDGRVGRNTMGKLDQLAKKGGGGGGDDVKPEVACGPSCGQPYVQIRPRVFVSLCSAKLKIGKPFVTTAGCPPNGVGNVGFFAGQPGWQLDGSVSLCTIGGAPVDPRIQIGYIQTAAGAMSMAVHRQPNKTLTTSECRSVVNARDCVRDQVAPWFDAPGTNFGPQPLGNTPAFADTPHLTKLKSRIGPRNQTKLQNIFLQGAFHIWLIARLPDGTIVFIHHWDVGLFARAMLNDGADPCSRSSYAVDGGAFEAGNGPGKGSATPVLTGKCANTLAKSC